MKHWSILASLGALLLLTACANVPTPQLDAALFRDDQFSAPSQRIDANDIFAPSDEMRHYLDTEIASRAHRKDNRQALFDALYSKGQLKLEYDSTMTRNAAQTFAARSGNCLSLVIMTAAFAKQLGLPVQYRAIDGEEIWSRIGQVYFSSRHVNLTLGKNHVAVLSGYDPGALLTIDFLPPEDLAGRRGRDIDEHTIVAMYMNNRAAEALTQGQLNDAYWWARTAIRNDPDYLTAYNTLGVIYHRHGNQHLAEQVFRVVLQHEPENTLAIYNLVQVLQDLGKADEAKTLMATLDWLEPDPPYKLFQLGQRAMQQGDFKAAKELFEREVKRDPYNHEFQFWLASAYFRLGNNREADRHLQLALENSTTRKDRELYGAKLGWLKAHRAQ